MAGEISYRSRHLVPLKPVEVSNDGHYHFIAVLVDS